jgi:hypothetical protein
MMKAELSDVRTKVWLIAFGLAAWSAFPVFGQDGVYAARVSSTVTTNWDAPFYWINYGDFSPYGTSTKQSTVTVPVGTPTRVGCYWHTSNNLSVGEGFGLIHPKGTQTGAVYEVDVTQPSGSQMTTDIIMNVGSTNCDIGGVFGATAAGGWTNTTAFQAAYSTNKWAFVCYLTNRSGVSRPHVDFKFVSAGAASLNHYADCVRFHLLPPVTNTLGSVRICSFSGNTVQYTGGSGARFVLLKCATLGNWQRVATNSATPSSFTIGGIGTEPAAFYTITSE